ncbi:MAG: hypothetical protein AAFY59_19035 [Pseudomonadota bacterium]
MSIIGTGKMIEWIWNQMARLQAFVDATRASAPEPLTLIIIVILAAFVIVWRLHATTAERKSPLPGESYLGKITPKTINAMTKNNRVQKPKSREDMERALKSRKRR